MEIRYERNEYEWFITDCPNNKTRLVDVEIYIIKAGSKSCKNCIFFDGYQNSKQI